MKISEAKEKVLFWSKRAYAEGLFAGTSGNLSIYLPEEKVVVITPSSIRYEDMSIEDIVVVDLTGATVEGNRKPSSEMKMHLAIYLENSQVYSVVHTHSPYATSFAVCQEPIPLVLIEMIPFLGGTVNCVPLQLPGTEELAQAVAKGLNGKNGCLLNNHGVVTVGDTIERAFIRAEYMEDAAKIATLARINGEPKLIPTEIEMKMKGI